MKTQAQLEAEFNASKERWGIIQYELMQAHNFNRAVARHPGIKPHVRHATPDGVHEMDFRHDDGDDANIFDKIELLNAILDCLEPEKAFCELELKIYPHVKKRAVCRQVFLLAGGHDPRGRHIMVGNYIDMSESDV